jgi:hypothetical protein
MSYEVHAGPVTTFHLSRGAGEYVVLELRVADGAANAFLKPHEARELATRLNALADAVDGRGMSPREAAQDFGLDLYSEGRP